MEDLQTILDQQKDFYNHGKTRDVSFRKTMLKTLRESIKHHEEEIMKALKLDLNKTSFEAYEAEIGIVLEEINFTLKHLTSWSKPKKVRTPIMHLKSTSYIYSEPYGSILIMSPWNYPFQLTMVPLIGAIAAGNCCVVKPSDYSLHTSDIMEVIIKEVFDDMYVHVVRGGREANKTLLDAKFDYIFFTGSPNVGKVVMESAAKHLTPMTLELGGKSPCILDDTANIKLAAKRIVWGKFLNAGQTCVAPDYILVHKKVKDELVQHVKQYIHEFYGSEPINSEDLPKIISQKHFHRLIGLLDEGNIITGGNYNQKTMQIAPTLIDEVSWDSTIMEEEIFGPLFPILTYDNLTDMIAKLQTLPKPLALYFFTTNKQNEESIIRNLSYGGGCINDTIVHLTNSHMPFGGVGESGMGQYHGKNSYETFTHKKSILKKSNLFDVFLRYPPFKDHLKLLKKIMK